MWGATGATVAGCCLLYATSRHQHILVSPLHKKGLFRIMGWGAQVLSLCCLWQIKSSATAVFMQILLMMLAWLLVPLVVTLLKCRQA
ncbi:hypothetical protein AZ09_06660 [Acetobacter aceti 1023]|nr:hypothetical protein AZ09_06660 [Acetobacter aceti 1023]